MSAPQLHQLVRQTHRFNDPLLPRIPSFDFPELKCEDHVTYVTASENEALFSGYWQRRGLRPMTALEPSGFPARHIAFLANPGEYTTCERMVGLSVSDDPASPVNRLVALYGGSRVDEHGGVAPGRLQHVAYATDADTDVDVLRSRMKAHGVVFMTPVLRFSDGTGATLTQMFVACTVPYGPFVEIVQRGVGENGEPFSGFSAEQIDCLYEHYDAYSKELLS